MRDYMKGSARSAERPAPRAFQSDNRNRSPHPHLIQPIFADVLSPSRRASMRDLGTNRLHLFSTGNSPSPGVGGHDIFVIVRIYSRSLVL